MENEAAQFDVEGESVALDHERYLEEIARLEKVCFYILFFFS